jgi:hypothetical protein
MKAGNKSFYHALKFSIIGLAPAAIVHSALA